MIFLKKLLVTRFLNKSQQIGKYDIRFYKGNYKSRQIQANRDKCVAYVEHHFNLAPNIRTSYVTTIIGYNASGISKNWGRWYSQQIGKEFRVPTAGLGGILIGGYKGRGNSNVKYTNMPSILLEPLFITNPQHAQWIRSPAGQNKLAKILAMSIVKFFPSGGRLGFSVGHKYKTSRPKDRGGAVYGGGTEADYAEIILKKTEILLTSRNFMEDILRIDAMKLKETIRVDTVKNSDFKILREHTQECRFYK